MNGSHHLPHARMRSWTTYQVTGARRTFPTQMSYYFEPFQESLPCLRTFQATTVP
jgi:hypothetical protein